MPFVSLSPLTKSQHSHVHILTLLRERHAAVLMGPTDHKRSTRLLCLYQGIALSRSTDLIHFPSIPCWVRQRSLDSHADNTHKDKKYIYIFFPCDIFRPQFRPSFVRLMFSSNTMQNDIISLISTELCIRYSYVIASIGNVLVQVCVCVARWRTG